MGLEKATGQGDHPGRVGDTLTDEGIDPRWSGLARQRW
jgi:hypothetical protein